MLILSIPIWILKPVTKWKTVVRTAWTHNCNFRCLEQCVEMLLKHFLFATLSVVNSFLHFPSKCSSGKTVGISRVRFQEFLVDWPYGCKQARFWQGKVRKSLQMCVVEPFGSIRYLGQIVGASWISLRPRPSLPDISGSLDPGKRNKI